MAFRVVFKHSMVVHEITNIARGWGSSQYALSSVSRGSSTHVPLVSQTARDRDFFVSGKRCLLRRPCNARTKGTLGALTYGQRWLARSTFRYLRQRSSSMALSSHAIIGNSKIVPESNLIDDSQQQLA